MFPSPPPLPTFPPSQPRRPRPTMQFHNTVRRAIAGRSTPEAIEVSEECSPLFEQTVLQLLKLPRPLSFCLL